MHIVERNITCKLLVCCCGSAEDRMNGMAVGKTLEGVGRNTNNNNNVTGTII